jgi:hypothetical protein
MAPHQAASTASAFPETALRYLLHIMSEQADISNT